MIVPMQTLMTTTPIVTGMPVTAQHQVPNAAISFDITLSFTQDCSGLA